MDMDSFSRWMPQVGLELRTALARIESRYRSVCEVTFSLAAGSLWFDDVQPMRHSREAAARIAEAGLTRLPARALGS
jgi:hypothetical protein